MAFGLAAGCKKQESEPAPDASNSMRPTSTGTVAGPIIADNGDINATLHELTLAVRRYVVSTHTVPKNFEEFAAKSQAQIPAPPPGKKYAIQGQAVVLIKR